MPRRILLLASSCLLLLSLSGFAQERKYYYTAVLDSIKSPAGVAVDPNGNIWYGSGSTTDSVGIRVLRPTGIPMKFSPIYSVTVGGTKYDVSKNLRGITTDQNGNIIVSIGSQLIRINSSDGTGMTYKKFPGTLTKPAVDASGNVYVTKVVASDPPAPPNPIWILNSNFDSIGVVDTTRMWSRALAVTPDGKDVYMGSLWQHVVQHYHSSDLVNYVLTDTLPGPIEGDTPGLDFDRQGRLWVAEYQNGRGWDKYFIYNLAAGTRDSLMGYGKNIIYSPRGVAFSSTGDTAYVASYDGGVIQEWVRSGPIPSLFCNFDDGSNNTNWGTRWSTFSDGATGTFVQPAPGDSVATPGGANGSPYCGYIKGAYASWGIGLYADVSPDMAPRNLAQFKGITFYAQGEAKPVRLVIRENKRFTDGTYDFYNYVFTPTWSWQKYTVLFPDSLTQMWPDPGSMEPFTLEDIVGIDFRPAASKDTIEVYVDDINFISVATGIKNPHGPGGVPAAFILQQNYPNPFNPTTTIEFRVPSSGFVSLKVYDILGREVATLVDGWRSPGSYSVTLDGSKLASGVYFYRLQAGSFTISKKMMLIK